jgi:CRISPR-associated protein Cas1
MSFHILHFFEHGGSLYKERGRLYFKTPGGLKSLPIANIRAIIIAAKGISISSQLISALLEVDCLLLHCDRRYQPIGWTLPAIRTMHQGILEGQISPRGRFRENLWNEVVRQKITNQRDILSYLKIDPNPLDRFLTGRLDEGGAARVYFGQFFRALEAIDQNRSQRHRGWLNALLNYGYAVLTSMVHRSIIVHGMMSNLGIHHKARYRSYPLVYDLMEPLRPLVDGLVVNWLHEWRRVSHGQTPEDGIHAFAKFIGTALREFRVSHDRYSLKMIDAIDLYTRDIAKSFQSFITEDIWMPSIDIDRLAAYDGRLKT